MLFESLIALGSFNRLIMFIRACWWDDHWTKLLVCQLRLMGETLHGSSQLSFGDFLTQFKARILPKKPTYSPTMPMNFQPIHLSLRENFKIDFMLEFIPSPILQCVFFADDTKIAIVTAAGMCLVVDSIIQRVESLFIFTHLYLDLI